jgi:hypothetical protein
MPDQVNVNQALVRILENALAGAKAGSFCGGAIVLATADRGFVHFANAGAFEFYLPLIAGSDILHDDLKHTMRQAQQQQANRLLRVSEKFKPQGGFDG